MTALILDLSMIGLAKNKSLTVMTKRSKSSWLSHLVPKGVTNTQIAQIASIAQEQKEVGVNAYGAKKLTPAFHQVMLR